MPKTINYNLQQEIDNAHGHLVLPPGQIVITKPVTIPSDFTLEGSNTEILINIEDKYAFELKGQKGTLAEMLHDKGTKAPEKTIFVDNASVFSVNDKIQITANAAYPYKAEFNTIVAIDGDKLTLKDSLLLNYMHNEEVEVISYQPLSNITIKNLNMTGGMGFKTFGIFADYTENLSITNVNFSNINVTPVHIENSFTPTVSHCTFTSNGRKDIGDHSVGIVLSMGAEVENNTLVDSGSIYSKGNSSLCCSYNSHEGVGQTGGSGINLISTFKSQIEGNSIIRANCYGIWVFHGSQNNIIHGNIISSNLSTGIYLGEEPPPQMATATLVDDTLANHGDKGLKALPINNNIISENICSSSVRGKGIFLDTMANYNQVTSNQTLDNKSYGILVHGSHNIITHNTSLRNGLKNIKVVCKHNHVHDNISREKTLSERLGFFCCGGKTAHDEKHDLEIQVARPN